MISMRPLTGRQGQGMTEYIIIVGLIALLLIAVVGQFKTAIQVTIEGSGESLERNNIGGDPPSLDGGGDATPPRRGTPTESADHPGYYRFDGDANWYQPNGTGDYVPVAPPG